jgi:hypothetical protein
MQCNLPQIDRLTPLRFALHERQLVYILNHKANKRLRNVFTIDSQTENLEHNFTLPLYWYGGACDGTTAGLLGLVT